MRRLALLLVLGVAACGPRGADRPDAGSGTDAAGGGAGVDGGARDAGADADAGHADAGASDAGPDLDGGAGDGGDPGPVRPAPLFDAALDWPAGPRKYFFSGPDYIRYDFTADSADVGYPKTIAGLWPGMFPADLDAAAPDGQGKGWFFRGTEVLRYDLATDSTDPGYPKALADQWPDVAAGLTGPIDAAYGAGDGLLHLFAGGEHLAVSAASGALLEVAAPLTDRYPGVWSDLDAAVFGYTGKVYFFRGTEYVRFDLATSAIDAGYPRDTRWWWAGLFDPDEGTGVPGDRLSPALDAVLFQKPSDTELDARRARVAASVGTGDVDRSSEFPLYLASLEERLGAWGCGIIELSSGAWRFRCATDTSGPLPVDLPTQSVTGIDWRTAAYHEAQVSQGDFMADRGTPLSIFRADGDVFYVEKITTNGATGSISAGLNVRVRYLEGGVERQIGYSHLSPYIPRYVIDAAASGTALPVGTVFGYIGYTGNLWMAAPPTPDAPYAGTGGGLPQSHSHLWFVNDAGNHLTLRATTREAMDYSGTYFFGGG